MQQPVLEVEGLTLEAGGHALVEDVSFSVAPGEMLALVGESGCGKTVTALAVLRLLAPAVRIAAGRIVVDGTDVRALDPEGLRRLRGNRAGMIFQEPMTSLNPVFTIGEQIAESLRIHRGMSNQAARARAVELLDLVGLPVPARQLDRYPHQMSGGQRQRVMIAIALSCDPKVLIADEPTTALDVTIQAQILELVRELRQKLGMAIVWITHDLGVIAGIADRAMVLYGGQIVEMAPVQELFARPMHPYTRALLKTVPRLKGVRAPKLEVIEGQPPIIRAEPSACAFRARCSVAMPRCGQENPLRLTVAAGHDVACFWDATTGEARHV